MNNQIPLYSPDGELLDWIEQKRMERLVAADLVMAVRTRKGEIRRLVLRRGADDPKPNCIADYLGTCYSFRERLDSGRLVWALKKLGKGDRLRPIFQQVVADCLANP
jgi:hypothetical protein